jgi:AcrR family transcriptional regulator
MSKTEGTTVTGIEPRPHGRRLSRDTVRQAMLETAVAMAVEAGIGIGLESMSVEEVIQNARVPRSSVYRIWPVKEMFLDDLLRYMAGRETYFGGQDVFDPQTFTVVAGVIEANQWRLATPEGRRAVLCEGVRLGVRRNAQALRESALARMHTALIATVSSTGSSKIRPEIARAIDDAEAASRRSIVSLFRDLILPTLGLRLRDPGATLDHMVMAGAVLIQGLALREILAEAVRGDQAGAPEAPAPESAGPASAAPEAAGPASDGRPTTVQLLDRAVPGPGLDGPPAEWSLVALAYLGLIDTFLEPDPDYRSPAAG